MPRLGQDSRANASSVGRVFPAAFFGSSLRIAQSQEPTVTIVSGMDIAAKELEVICNNQLRFDAVELQQVHLKKYLLIWLVSAERPWKWL